jgi:allantoinase
MLGMPSQDVGNTDLIVRGMVRLGDGQFGRGHVSISGGVIVGVGAGDGPLASQRLDVGESWILPGIVDAHVHCLSHPGEGVEAATRSAAAGGVTTIVEMPFDKAGPINSAQRLTANRELVADQAIVDVALLATLAPGGGWTAADELAEGGACGFKVSLFHTDSARFPRIDDAELMDVFAAVAATGRPVCVHAENDEIIKALVARCRNAGDTGPDAHGRTRPPISETQAVLTVLETSWHTGARAHLCHLSTPRAVDLARHYVAGGADVTVETCPHFLLLSTDDVARQGSRLKINPPVRDEATRDGLWQRLLAGEIDVIGSDHAPWPLEHKTHADVFENHSGVPGVETMAPLVLGAALQRGPHAFDAALDALTAAPARRFGLDRRKGALAVGLDADLIVFDPAASSTVDERRLHSNAGWSPYHGMVSTGRITRTLVRGHVVWDGEKILADAGDGVLVSP